MHARIIYEYTYVGFFVLAVYLVNEHELALYEERQYLPGFNSELIERFVKRPDQFTVQRFRIEGLNASIFDEYCEVINGGSKPKTILDIAKPLATFMSRLPDYTLKTKNGMSKKALAFRPAFNLSKSPEHLIFEGLPKALGFGNLKSSGTTVDGFAISLKEVLRELSQAHDKLKAGIQASLAQILDLDADTSLERLRDHSRVRCRGLESYTLDIQGVRGLLVRINREDDSDELWFENILMFIGAKPSKKWTDLDRDEAEYKLAQLSRRLTELFRLATEDRHSSEQTDSDFDVYMLKSLKKGSDFIDEVVTIDRNRATHSKGIKDEIHSILQRTESKELQLAALAQVVDEFLHEKKISDSRVRDSKIELITHSKEA